MSIIKVGSALRILQIFYIKAVFILRQGCLSEKHGANRTQHSHRKQRIFWSLGD
jgi:hypothetical protein